LLYPILTIITAEISRPRPSDNLEAKPSPVHITTGRFCYAAFVTRGRYACKSPAKIVSLKVLAMCTGTAHVLTAA